MDNSEKDEKIKEKVLEEEELEQEKEIKEEIKERRKKRKTGRIIGNVIFTVLFLVLVFEAAIGIINMQRINDEKDPVWYLSTDKKETELKTETIYNLGLYKIVKTDTSKKTTVTLRPFFIGD